MKKLSIAIDGPAGAGKSSVSKILAARLGYAYLDTGAMYRAVTYEALERKLTDDDAIADMAAKLDMEVIPEEDTMHVIVDGKDVTPFIRTPEVSSHVSAVSAIAGVRSAMTAIQRKLGRRGHRAGRPGHRHHRPAPCGCENFPHRLRPHQGYPAV